MQVPSITKMLKSGLHFGHETSKWYPKMEPYIFGQRQGIHVIDLEQTQEMLNEMLQEVKEMAANGDEILFVSTKPQAQDSVEQAAQAVDMPYLTDRWIGGLFTNFSEVRKSVDKYLDLKEQQATGELERYTKKEQVRIAKYIEKKEEYLGGLASMEELPDAIFVPSVHQEKIATKEAEEAKIKVIGMCDTNANPEEADIFAPGNDDAIRSIKLVVKLVAKAIEEGLKEGEKKQQISENQ